jgi:hypothetical protein
VRLGLSPLTLGLLLALLWASACGGATGRNQRGDESTAGEQHLPSDPGRGGAGNAVGGGAASVGGIGDVGGTAGAGTSAAAGAPADAGGAHGGAETDLGGAGGQAGAGGEGGAPLECRQPLDCRDILGDLECGTNRYRDDCGGTFRCDCADGLVCEQNRCVVCDPGPDPCVADTSLCGETRDRCGGVVVCPDNCATLAAGGACYEGRCCAPSKTSCSAHDCGQMLVGCGQSLDCTATVCPNETTCQASGKCCKPTSTCAPTNCGLKDDGCGNYLECSYACPEGTVCLENECVSSECQVEAFECGQAYNAEVDGLEYCGTCPGALACRDNFCLPLCD